MTDTDSCLLQFIFVCNSKTTISGKDSCNLIFQVMLQSKLKHRLDTSNDFYDKFDFRNPNLEKRVGLCAVESINNPNIITIAVNPKEFF